MRQQGTQIAGRYRLIEKLGEGGMGVTWKARDERTANDVVIKFLRISEAKDWKTVELFEREIEVLRNLDHPRIPRLIQGNADPNGDWFLVQALAPGDPIQSLLDRNQRFDEAILRGIADQILQILTYLQTRSPPVIHRDLKPDNLIVDGSGEVQLVDFGAASLSVTDRNLGGSTVVGTFGYMAPEQFRGVSRPATDLYGLGMTLIVMATGRKPEQLETEGLKVQFEDLAELSRPFEAWLSKLIEPDAADRFENAEEALAVLRRLDELTFGGSPSLVPISQNVENTALERFQALAVRTTDKGVELTYRRRNFRGTMIIFAIVGSIMAAASMAAFAFEAIFGLFLAIFAVVFGGIGMNHLLTREQLTFINNGEWHWRKRNLFGTSEHAGNISEIAAFNGSASGMKINNTPLHRVTMSTHFGDHHLFTGLSRGEAAGLSRELSELVGIEASPQQQGVGVHIARAFDEALQQAAQKGGILGKLADSARKSPALKEALTNQNTSQHQESKTAKQYRKSAERLEQEMGRSHSSESGRRYQQQEVAAEEEVESK